MKKPLLLTFYGDDFTGSTDAMEALSLGGVRTVLFLQALLRRYRRVIGRRTTVLWQPDCAS